MSANRDSWVFALTVAAASASLVSIAGAETLLAAACLGWIIVRPRPLVWPSYFVPLCAFMLTTTIALMMSPEPDIGMSAIRKFVLFTMGFLTANVVTTPVRTRIAHRAILAVGAVAALYALIQFAIKYVRFLKQLADDPTVNASVLPGSWVTG
jgi:hypothetical protein